MKLNRIVLGTVQLGMPYGINNLKGQPNIEDALSILDYALDSGITTLDTARAYGNSLKVIGEFHRKSTSRFDIINKFHLGQSNLEDNVKADLKHSHINKFAAYLFHSFNEFENINKKDINEINALKNQGLVSKLGVSVYTNEQFKKAIESNLIDVIQLPYNLLDNYNYRGKLLEKAKINGKEIHTRSVFLQGLLLMQQTELPKGLIKLAPYIHSLKEIAFKAGLTLQELAVAYVLENKLIDKVLFGVETLEQLKINFKIISNVKPLNAMILEEINAIKVVETNLLNPVNWNSI